MKTPAALIKDWKTWLAIYAFALATVYQHVYWSAFGISPMAYLGLQDIVRLSVPALLIAALGMLTVALGVYGMDRLRAKLGPVASQSRGVRTAVAVAGLMAIAVMLIFMSWNIRSKDAVPFGVLMGFLTASVLIVEVTDVVPESFSKYQRLFVILVLALGPILIVSKAIGTARHIRDGSAYYRAVVHAGAGKSLCADDWPDDARHLGSINEYVFFAINGATCVVRAESLPAVTLIRHVEPGRIRIPFRDDPAWHDNYANTEKQSAADVAETTRRQR